MEIREKPLWMRLMNRDAAVAFFGNVYLPKGLKERLEREDPERLSDLVDHEMIHVARQHAAGMVRWHLGYVLSRRARWREERAAYHSTLRRLRARGRDLAGDQRERLARELSGVRYLFMTSREEARAFIDRVLEKP